MEPYLAEPGGTLVEPWWLHHQTTWTTPQPLQNLVELWWNPGGTFVEPYLKPPTTPQPSQNLVELWWNPGGTLWSLTSGPPRTTLEPIWAETPKLSAVGENKTKHTKQKNNPPHPHIYRAPQPNFFQPKRRPLPPLPPGALNPRGGSMPVSCLTCWSSWPHIREGRGPRADRPSGVCRSGHLLGLVWGVQDAQWS